MTYTMPTIGPGMDDSRRDWILRKWDAVRAANGERDSRHHDLISIRSGNAQEIQPDFFPDSWPKQIIANTIDIASTDLGEMVGVLPSISCPPVRTAIAKSKSEAEKRTKVTLGYVAKSKLQKHMYAGADGFFCFGFLPIVVEANFEESTPVLRVDSPVGAYYELDLFGRTRCYFKRWQEPVGSIKAKFPEIASKLERNHMGAVVNDATEIEIVKYYGPDYNCIFAPDVDEGTFLAVADNPTGEVPVFIAERPKWDKEIRGQFDQTIWVQMARARQALDILDISSQAVNAPISVPRDATKLSFGKKAVWRSDSPIRPEKLQINIPGQVFANSEQLRQEERIASRYPEGRSGNIDASVITGQGVEALLGTMSSQIRVAQDQIRAAVGEALSYALRMDVSYWPDVEKTTSGMFENERFRERYTPSKDIDDFQVDATYGMMSGLDFSRALVAMLQMRGDKLVSRAEVRRNLPEGMGGVGVEAEVDIEDLGDAMKQTVFAMAAGAAQPGMDPSQMLERISRMMAERSKGTPLQDAIIKALEPTPEEKAAMEAQAAQAAQANPLAAALGQAGAAPEAVNPATSPGGNEGMGSIQQLLAGLSTTGKPELGARVTRILPAP